MVVEKVDLMATKMVDRRAVVKVVYLGFYWVD